MPPLACLRYLSGANPFRLVAVDADTGKPIDPNIGRKTYVTYYDVKKDKKGNKVIERHRTQRGSQVGEGQGKDEQKKCCKCDGGGEKKPEGRVGKKEGNGDGGDSNEKTGSGGDDDKPFTPDEDAKIKAMKAEGRTWNQIATELGNGRTKGAVSGRCKELSKTEGQGLGRKPNASGERSNEKDNTKPAAAANKPAMTKAEKKTAKKAAAAEAATAATANAPPPASKPASTHGSAPGSEVRYTLSEWQTLQEDSTFSFGELQCLSEIINQDLTLTWGRVAARFYDLTGRRIHPDEIREKFEAMVVGT
ncbi:hypothetical protein BAUCODRAFT_144848 [Baudoinia panamericana UAMH 10762]|uniref:Myb-like domain-containing protein n=1 Tax=Baudoinia panamericana (strain UAMH 10762) TaxID=717646 RepID=M2MWE1_BAUPA|nr:uncharacterized protein BAUCODRAFT_144848 [Baudoinia panamericana UAMH 10762]EMD01312.1 hypothetical protein BAUCODRAFT_144848 [Baudoinia panamericana UAMH 10762]